MYTLEFKIHTFVQQKKKKIKKPTQKTDQQTKNQINIKNRNQGFNNEYHYLNGFAPEDCGHICVQFILWLSPHVM